MHNNKEIVLHHHLGLGDHFVCNGLVHEVSKDCDKIHLPTKQHNFNTVNCLYKDWDNIDVFPVIDEHRDILRHCAKHNLPLLKVGFEYLSACEEDANVCFYKQLGLDFSVRYTSFKLPKQISSSETLYDTLIHDKKDYCLIHQRSSTGNFFMNIETGLPVIEIKPGLTDNLLDYAKIIENATEIHCIDSSVINLVEGMPIQTNKLFFHTIKPDRTSFKFSDKWDIINYEREK